MITLTKTTTGKQLFSIAKKAMKARQKQIGQRVHITDFCNVSGLSRTQLYGYNKGDNPGPEGLAKIATGLRAWGNEVTIDI
jgi:hypothetical protein